MKHGRNLPAQDQSEWLTEQLRDPELCVAYLNAALAAGESIGVHARAAQRCQGAGRRGCDGPRDWHEPRCA